MSVQSTCSNVQNVQQPSCKICKMKQGSEKGENRFDGTIPSCRQAMASYGGAMAGIQASPSRLPKLTENFMSQSHLFLYIWAIYGYSSTLLLTCGKDVGKKTRLCAACLCWYKPYDLFNRLGITNWAGICINKIHPQLSRVAAFAEDDTDTSRCRFKFNLWKYKTAFCCSIVLAAAVLFTKKL